MGQKRKISIRKVLQVLLTLVVTGGCITAILSASKIENEKKLAGIDIEIKNGNKYKFLDKPQIMDMLISNRHINIQGLPIGTLDIHSMEGIIDANPWVANAEVFVDNTRMLHIYVTQRVPVARVFDNSGSSYYLDTTLSEMPLSGQYIHYTTIVTNVPVLKNDSLGRSIKGQIVSLVRYIEHDTFWNAQISQIIMDTDNTFELVPVLGDQRIVFGDTSRMKDKFDNLFVFYKKVLNRIGWDKYQMLDVRFKDQVVASPSLPWKGPVDKSMSSMSWVKNIIESGPKDKDVSAPDTLSANTKTVAAPAKEKSPVKEQVKPTAQAKQTNPQANAKATVQTKQTKPKTAASIIPQHKPAVTAKASQTKKPQIIKQKAKTTKDNKEDKSKTPKYIYH